MIDVEHLYVDLVRDEVDGVVISTMRCADGEHETMIIGGPADGEWTRYASREEAIAGHAAAVARVRLDALLGPVPSTPAKRRRIVRRRLTIPEQDTQRDERTTNEEN